MEHRHSNDDEVEAHYYHPTASRKRSPGATPAETAQAEAAAGRRRTVAVVAAVVLGVTLVYVLAQQPVFRNAVTAVLRFIEHDTGPVVGSALFVLLDVLCIVLMLPGTPLNLAAGYLFGFVRGSVVSVVGITLGAVTAFLLGRTVLHRWAEQKASSSPRLRIALDAMKQSAFQMVFLLRLSPVMPFPVLSYVLGASPALSFGTYTLATFAGILPMTMAYCYIGQYLGSLSEMWSRGNKQSGSAAKSGSRPSTATVMVVVVVVSTVAITWFIARCLHRTCHRPAHCTRHSTALWWWQMDRHKASVGSCAAPPPQRARARTRARASLTEQSKLGAGKHLLCAPVVLREKRAHCGDVRHTGPDQRPLVFCELACVADRLPLCCLLLLCCFGSSPGLLFLLLLLLLLLLPVFHLCSRARVALGRHQLFKLDGAAARLCRHLCCLVLLLLLLLAALIAVADDLEDPHQHVVQHRPPLAVDQHPLGCVRAAAVWCHDHGRHLGSLVWACLWTRQLAGVWRLAALAAHLHEVAHRRPACCAHIDQLPQLHAPAARPHLHETSGVVHRDAAHEPRAVLAHQLLPRRLGRAHKRAPQRPRKVDQLAAHRLVLRHRRHEVVVVPAHRVQLVHHRAQRPSRQQIRQLQHRLGKVHSLLLLILIIVVVLITITVANNRSFFIIIFSFFVAAALLVLFAVVFLDPFHHNHLCLVVCAGHGAPSENKNGATKPAVANRGLTLFRALVCEGKPHLQPMDAHHEAEAAAAAAAPQPDQGDPQRPGKSTATRLMDEIDELEQEELRLEERLLVRGESGRAALLRVAVLGVLACVGACVWSWFAPRELGVAMRLLPLCVVLVAMSLCWSLVSCCCDMRGIRDERRLAKTYSRARDAVRVLRDEVDYDRTLQLLARMDKPSAERLRKQQQQQQQQQMQRRRASQMAQQQQQQQPQHRRTVSSILEQQQQQGIQVLVNGQDVTLKMLLCARCHYNNGYVPQQEWDTIRFRCRSCGSLNARAPQPQPQAREQAPPTAPAAEAHKE